MCVMMVITFPKGSAPLLENIWDPQIKKHLLMLCLKKHFLILCITGLNPAFNFTAFRQLSKKD